MDGKQNTAPSIINYFLEPGYVFISKKPAVISGVLGSCVVVAVYDRRQKLGGMNHFRLPRIDDREKATAIFGNAATIALVRMMIEGGAKRRHMEAQILGGASRSDMSRMSIGRENVMTARKILLRERIKIVSEDVGGQMGRKIIFNTHTNEMAVIKVEKIRVGDWYPYEDDR